MTTTTPVLNQPGGPAPAAAIDFETTKEVGYYRLVWRRFRQRKIALVAAIALGVLILACIAGPIVLPAECVDLSPGQVNLAPLAVGHSISAQCGVGSHFHLLGTDDSGRDLLLRNLAGGRISLLVGFSTMIVTILVATFLGAFAGFFGGVVDTAVTGLTNGVLSIPSILLLIIFVKTANPRGDAQLSPTVAIFLDIILGIVLVAAVLAFLSGLGKLYQVALADRDEAASPGAIKPGRTALGVLAGFVAAALAALFLWLIVGHSSAPVLGGVVFKLDQRITAVLIIVLAIALITWPQTARIVRSVVLSVREKEFVEAARALGTPRMRLILRHLLPNALGPIVVSASLTIGIAILTESAISFLGYGINPPTATWGNILEEGRSLDLSSTAGFFFDVWPGMLILLAVLSFNYIGDALRDAFDPRSLER